MDNGFVCYQFYLVLPGAVPKMIRGHGDPPPVRCWPHALLPRPAGHHRLRYLPGREKGEQKHGQRLQKVKLIAQQPFQPHLCNLINEAVAASRLIIASQAGLISYFHEKFIERIFK